MTDHEVEAFVLSSSEAGSALRLDADAEFAEIREFVGAVRDAPEVSVRAVHVPWAGPYEVIMTIIGTGSDVGGFAATVWALVQAGKRLRRRITVRTSEGVVVLDPDRDPTPEEVERVRRFLLENSADNAAAVADQRLPGMTDMDLEL